jgi:signal transduction histidine kinase
MMTDQTINLMQALAEPSLLVSGTGRLLEANGSAARLLNTSRAALRDQSLPELAVDAPAKIAAYLRRCSGTRQPMPGALTLRTGASEPTVYRCTSTLVQPGSPTAPAVILLQLRLRAEADQRFILLNRKIEELNAEIRKRLRVEEQLRLRAAELMQLNEQLLASNQELDAFTYIASHDLKEPLRGLHNYAHFLLEDYAEKLAEEGVAQLHTMIRLTQRMEALIESLLYYSRVGRQQLEVQETSLQIVLEEVLQMLAPGLQEARVEIRLAQPLPVVKADRTMIGEVFTNLISNAVKYNDQTGKWVEIGYEDAAQPVVYVRDNGIGIPAEHYENIFRIFKRLHGRDEYNGGTGAGLTIVKKIIERHGGRIWLESRPGAGTTFYFTLATGNEEQFYETSDFTG